MNDTPTAAPLHEDDETRIADFFINAEGGQIVRDMAGHVGDEIYEVLKRHGMTMTTAAGAIGVGVLAGVQALNETLEFAVRSVDTEAEKASIAAGVAVLVGSYLDHRLAHTARPDAGNEDVERVEIPREPTEAMMSAGLHQSSHDSEWADVNQTWQAMFDAATLDGGSSTHAPAAMREGVVTPAPVLTFSADVETQATAASQKHQAWSADQTAYLRSLDPEDRSAWAVHYQGPPVRNESGSTSYSLNFPVLIVSAYANEPEAVARRVVDILNKHWDEVEA